MSASYRMSVMKRGLVFFAIVLTACGGVVRDVRTGATPSVVTSPTVSATPCEPTRGGAEGVLVFLTNVTVDTQPDSDRVTFEFRAAPGSPAKVPAYETREGGKPPFKKDPGEEPLQVEGSSFMSIIFHGATGYDMSSERETYTGPKEFKPDFDVLVEAEEQGDFEATLGWLFGMSRPTCWKVTEMTDPLRAVIDFTH